MPLQNIIMPAPLLIPVKIKLFLSIRPTMKIHYYVPYVNIIILLVYFLRPTQCEQTSEVKPTVRDIIVAVTIMMQENGKFQESLYYKCVTIHSEYVDV